MVLMGRNAAAALLSKSAALTWGCLLFLTWLCAQLTLLLITHLFITSERHRAELTGGVVTFVEGPSLDGGKCCICFFPFDVVLPSFISASLQKPHFPRNQGPGSGSDLTARIDHQWNQQQAPDPIPDDIYPANRAAACALPHATC